MKITFYGHSCFSVEINGKHLLFDPYITPNEKANNVDVASIKADYILISHGHEDHISDVRNIYNRTEPTLISNYEIITWFGNKGLSNGHPLNHGGSCKFDFGTVKYVNAIHSSTLPDESPGGNPGGFVIESDEGNFYFAGDTALHLDMKLIPLSTKLDFAVLPIGDNFTMGIADAVRAAGFVETNKVLGVHYDTFGYIEIDHNAAKESFKNEDIELYLPEIGETIEI